LLRGGDLGDPPAAREHRTEAEALAQELAVGPDSDLAKEIAKRRTAFDASSSPRRD